MPRSRRILIGSVVGVIGLLLVLVIVLSRGESSPTDAGRAVAESTSSTTAAVNHSANRDVTTTVPPSGPFTTPNMPVDVRVSGSERLRSGDRVTVHASPTTGSQLFGVEARLCRGGVAIESEGDFTPTRGGNCIVDPLAPSTDAKVLQAGEPPYGGIDVQFVVGTGTDSFLTQFDGQKSVTCDAQNPCQIVLKLQYPNGFGFMGVPVTFG